MATELWLVRHGDTAWSTARRHTGRTDVALTAEGEARARELRELLHAISPAEVLCSPLQRARRTCELAGFGAQAAMESDLEEWNYGDYEGLTSAEIHQRAPDWNLFHDGCPGGESIAQIAQRADRMIARLQAMPGRVMIFSHGHFLRSLAVRWIGRPIADAQHLALTTASLSLLAYEHPDRANPTLSLWNASAVTLPFAFAPSAAPRPNH